MPTKNILSTKNTRLLIFGGTGFLGSNLINQLTKNPGQITVVSKKSTLSIRPQNAGCTIKTIHGNITNNKFVNSICHRQDIIISLAGLGPAQTLHQPLKDLKTACQGSLNVLEFCRYQNPNAHLIFIGSRLELGKIDHIPASENTPSNPTTIYGIHRSAVTKYAHLYHQLFNLNTHVLRLSNTYGPHDLPAPSNYNLINHFVDQAIQNKPLTIYGTGQQTRDYLYIDDAINAILQTIAHNPIDTPIINIGGGGGIQLIEAARTIIKIAGQGKISSIPWPKYARLTEAGNYATHISRAKKLLRWQPKINFNLGIKKTVRAQSKLLNSTQPKITPSK